MGHSGVNGIRAPLGIDQSSNSSLPTNRIRLSILICAHTIYRGDEAKSVASLQLRDHDQMTVVIDPDSGYHYNTRLSIIYVIA